MQPEGLDTTCTRLRERGGVSAVCPRVLHAWDVRVVASIYTPARVGGGRCRGAGGGKVRTSTVSSLAPCVRSACVTTAAIASTTPKATSARPTFILWRFVPITSASIQHPQHGDASSRAPQASSRGERDRGSGRRWWGGWQRRWRVVRVGELLVWGGAAAEAGAYVLTLLLHRPRDGRCVPASAAVAPDSPLARPGPPRAECREKCVRWVFKADGRWVDGGDHGIDGWVVWPQPGRLVPTSRDDPHAIDA